MAETPNISPIELMRLAKQLKAAQGAQQEAEQLERLAKTGLDGGQQEKLHSLMRDKAKLAELMRSPQALELIKKLGGKKEET